MWAKKIWKNGWKLPNVGKRYKLIDSRSQVYPNRIIQRNLCQDTSKSKTKDKEKYKEKILKAYGKMGGIIYKHKMIQMTEDFS